MSERLHDYLDILHIYRSDMVHSFPPAARKNHYGINFISRVVNCFEGLAQAVKHSLLPVGISSNTKEDLEGKNWIYVLGLNNYHSLRFLEGSLENYVYVTPFKFALPDTQVIQLRHPNRLWFMLAALPYFIRLLFSRGNNIGRCWDVAFRVLGLQQSYASIIKKFRPQTIFFSNDHAYEARAFLKAANSHSIPTFYIQHACIRSDFPPLLFDLSLLEGKDAKEKYEAAGPVRGSIKLIGLPRMDNMIGDKNKSRMVRRIGICTNLLDEIKTIESVVAKLKERFPETEITYRPHPTDERPVVLPDEGVLRSDSKQQSVFEFLKEQDLVIAGNTSIHYEAVALNIISIYFDFNPKGKTYDMYGFIKNGFIEESKTADQLFDLIKISIDRKENVWEKAQYYNATLGTPDEGNSSQLAMRYIEEFLTANSANTSKSTNSSV